MGFFVVWNIVTNRNHSVLYIDVTNCLARRVWEHREGTGAAFAADCRCKNLTYYEHYREIRDAIARESQSKKWSRSKKIALINRFNPSWLPLGRRRAARKINSKRFDSLTSRSLSLRSSRRCRDFPSRSILDFAFDSARNDRQGICAVFVCRSLSSSARDPVVIVECPVRHFPPFVGAGRDHQSRLQHTAWPFSLIRSRFLKIRPCSAFRSILFYSV
jgi:putative endonuclease